MVWFPCLACFRGDIRHQNPTGKGLKLQSEMPEPSRKPMSARPLSRRTRLAALLLALACSSAGCQRATPSTATPAVAPAAGAARYDPAHELGPLFHDVQLAALFPDSKTFVDARPSQSPGGDRRALRRWRRHAGFRPARVRRRSTSSRPDRRGRMSRSTRRSRMEEHIRALWPALTRPADAPDPRSSLIPLPNAYVVPGGRFREVYYWDSYFTMLGLVESGRTDLVRSMLDNFAYLVRTVGHIPNGNRTYYLEPQPAAVLRARWSASTRGDGHHRGAAATSTRSRPSMRSGWTGAEPAGAGDAPYRRVVQAARWRAAQSLLGRRAGAEARIVPRGLRARRRRVPAAQRARRSIATCARRRRADGISPAAGCAIQRTFARSRRPIWCRWT